MGEWPRDTVKPIVWMRELRDHGAIGGGQLAALWSLALRMRKDGSGFASRWQLAMDSLTSEATVKRAIAWAQKNGYLVRTRKGHRLNGERSLASEYRLHLPSQWVTQTPWEPSGGQSADSPNGSLSQPNGSQGASNGSPQTPPGVLSQGSVNDSSVQALGARSPDGDREGDPFALHGQPITSIDDLEMETFDDPFKLGMRVAEICNEGIEFVDEQFRDLFLQQFGYDEADEAQAWAGLHRFLDKSVQERMVPW